MSEIATKLCLSGSTVRPLVPSPQWDRTAERSPAPPPLSISDPGQATAAVPECLWAPMACLSLSLCRAKAFLSTANKAHSRPFLKCHLINTLFTFLGQGAVSPKLVRIHFMSDNTGEEMPHAECITKLLSGPGASSAIQPTQKQFWESPNQLIRSSDW